MSVASSPTTLFPIFGGNSPNNDEEIQDHDDNITPTPSIITYNCRSLSAYSLGRAWVSRRRKRIIENLIYLSRNNQIIHLQETKLLPHENLTLAIPALSQWGKFYSSKSERSAGCVTLVSPSILRDYTPSQIHLDDSLRGHALALNFAPKHTRMLPFMTLNLYLYAGSDQIKKAAMINKLLSIPPKRFCFVSGDFNMIESREDTSSDTDYHVMGTTLYSAWHSFLEHLNLSEITQSTHTYYHITRDLSKSRTTRLDRHYCSLSEVDLALNIPDSTIAAVPHSILNVFGMITAEQLQEMDADEQQIELMKKSSASDHLPIRLAFRSSAKVKHSSKKIPVWIARDPRFGARVETLWRQREECIESHDPFDELADFKIILHQASEDVLRMLKKQKEQPVEDLSKFTIGAALLRLVQRKHLDRNKIHNYIKRYPYLNSMIIFHDGEYDTNKLRDHLAELLTRGEMEGLDATPDPLDVHHQTKSNSLVKQVKLLLPSTRKRLGGLRRQLQEELSTDPKAMGGMAKEYWEDIWTADVDTRPPRSFLKSYNKKGPKRLQPRVPGATEFTEVIHSTNNSCAGPDGIPFAAYRSTKNISAEIMARVMKAMAAGVAPPSGYNNGLLFLIPKTGSGLAADTRPITVTNADNRIIAKAVVVALTPYLQHVLHKAQQGFIKGRTGRVHIRELNHRFYRALEKKGHNYHILFMDTRKAFDTIEHAYIIETLKRIGLPDWVVTVVSSLLSEVFVTPILNGETGVWIRVSRGVKQGCPLSPILFAICYDPLLEELTAIKGVDVYAFADDVALGTPKLKCYDSAQAVIDDFQAATGQVKNEDKTAIVSAKGSKAKAWILNSRWPKVKFKDSHTYLGVLIGSKVTTRDIYAQAVDKFVSRITRYRKALKSLALVYRVVTINVYCITIFSYLMHFAPFPVEASTRGVISLHDRIVKLITCTLIPFGGKAYKYVHLIQPHDRVSPQPALKDVWALSASILTQKARLEDWEGLKLVPGYASNSMRQSVMVKAMASDAIAFHLGAYYPDDGPAVFSATHFRRGTPPTTRKAIYDRMVYASFHEEQDKDIAEKLAKRGLTDTREMVYYLHANYGRLHKRLPHAARHTQFALLFNSLVTDRRYRMILAKDDYKCHFCGNGEDHIRHIWNCGAVLDGWAIFTRETGLKLGATSLGAKDTHHVFNLAFDGSGKDKEINAICVFNWSVWSVRQKYFKWLTTTTTRKKVSGIISDSAILRYAEFARLTTTKKKKVQKNKIDNYLIHREEILDLIATIPSHEAVCYTDGSALGNPGPSGAGAVLTFPGPHGPELLEGIAPLGHSTNNVGELWAIGMAIQMLEAKEAAHSTNATPLHIFTDSKYSIGLIKGNIIRTNVLLGNTIKNMVTARRRRAPISVHWVKGHLGLDGNEQADLLAKMGAKKSRTLVVEINGLIQANRFWDPGGLKRNIAIN